MSRDYDQRVLVVNDESADERVLVVNGDVVNTTTAAEGDFLARQSGLWVPRKIADADIPSSITRDTELSAAVSAEAALRAAADAGLQPLDSDLSAIAALTTTSFGRSLLTQASAAATRSTLGAATAYTVLSKTADYTLAAGDWVEGNSTGGAFSLTLPTSPATGNIVGVKKVDSSANAITIVGTIDGVTNPTMTKQWHSYEVIYDGTSWRNLRRPTAAGLVDWPATPDARYLQISNNLSDITPATGRTNLGLGTAATANKVAAGATGVLDATDATTTNARTPTAHASTHLAGSGSDVPGVRWVQKKITAADYSFNKPSSTTWYEADSTNLRATLNAAVGDLLIARIHGIWNLEARFGVMDVASVVSGSPVNWWGGGGGAADFGIPSLYGPASVQMPIACSISKVLVSGDISSGQVTLSPFVRIGTINVLKTLFADSTIPFFFSIENKGPVTAP